MKKWIDLEFEPGQTIYLKTDEDQKKRIVLAVSLRQTGLLYEVGCGPTSSWHYGFEMSETRDVVIKTSDR